MLSVWNFFIALAKCKRCCIWNQCYCAGTFANGSLQGVTSGKHHNRTLGIHATLAEALDRLLWFQFSMKFDIADRLKSIENAFKNYGVCPDLFDIDSQKNRGDVKSLIADF